MVTRLLFCRYKTTKKAKFLIFFAFTARWVCVYAVIVFPLHCKISPKMYLIENKKVTLLHKLNR